MGWDYAIQWLTILPFEISAAGLTINFWHTYNIGIWIAVFLVVLSIIQIFGVRGYGEGEHELAHGSRGLPLTHSQSNSFCPWSKSWPAQVSSSSVSSSIVAVSLVILEATSELTTGMILARSAMASKASALSL